MRQKQMARKNNFLLGNGEKLTGPVSIPKGGGPKNPPYEPVEAKQRFQERARKISTPVRSLAQEACPGDEAVISITMHPRYVSKSDFPTPLFNALGLRPVGSRITKVKPDKWGIKKHPKGPVLTEEIFLAGKRSKLLELDTAVKGLSVDSSAAEHLSHIEDISFLTSESKQKNISTGWLEVVLHNQTRVDVLSAFKKYAAEFGAEVDVKRSRKIGGLTFVPVSTTKSSSKEMTQFQFLRIARSMPTLRPIAPTLLRSVKETVVLPTDNALSPIHRALIFDGGVPASALQKLKQWVTLIEPKNIGPSHPSLEAHGLQVTSAFLFGPIENTKVLRRPVCLVDHVRVLDGAPSTDPYYYDVLDRILLHIDTDGAKYHLINLSMGPNMPMDDGDVTLWTSALDERFASGKWVVTVAAGNDGKEDHDSGMNRVQPPGDGVNMITVGASDSARFPWNRADYSCIGPGRCPGIVKPDGLAFGGSDKEPFNALAANLEVEGIQGTSFASPLALRSAAAVKAQLGDSLNSLAIRALMIHTVDKPARPNLSEIGWGRFESNPEQLITCEDHEALVIYQGELPLGEHLRAPIPLPANMPKGMLEITATLLIATEVDPGHPSAYTRSGLTVAFRPNASKFTKSKRGISSTAKTLPFFSPGNMYGGAEFELRDDGHKWEPCHHARKRIRAVSLKNPCFDIYNHRRFEGVATDASVAAKYALVVTVKGKIGSDLYNGIVRAYSNVLIPLQPKIRIEIKN